MLCRVKFNRFCASGLSSSFGCDEVRSGFGNLVVGQGGGESMSRWHGSMGCWAWTETTAHAVCTSGIRRDLIATLEGFSREGCLMALPAFSKRAACAQRGAF